MDLVSFWGKIAYTRSAMGATLLLDLAIGVATLIAVVAVWVYHNLFFNTKMGNNGISIGICQYHFVVVVFVVTDRFLKPLLFCVYVMIDWFSLFFNQNTLCLKLVKMLFVVVLKFGSWNKCFKVGFNHF